MCYRKIDAFKHSDGSLFEHEHDAIHHDIAKVIDEPLDPRVLTDNASTLVTLLQRFLAAEKPKTKAPPPEPTTPRFANIAAVGDDIENHPATCGAHRGAACDCTGDN